MHTCKKRCVSSRTAAYLRFSIASAVIVCNATALAQSKTVHMWPQEAHTLVCGSAGTVCVCVCVWKRGGGGGIFRSWQSCSSKEAVNLEVAAIVQRQTEESWLSRHNVLW